MAPYPNTTDTSLINELYEAIELYPKAVEPRKLLVQQYAQLGWLEAASDAARELFNLAPDDVEVQHLCHEHAEKSEKPVEQPVVEHAATTVCRSIIPTLPEDLTQAMLQLAQGYQGLRMRAKDLQHDLGYLRALKAQQGSNPYCNKQAQDIRALVEGRIFSVLRVQRPRGARVVAASIGADHDEALDVIMKDLTDVRHWILSGDTDTSQPDEDAIREAIVKRVCALQAVLPDDLQAWVSEASMHFEHEVLRRRYVCDETMYGDPVAEIPRANFWVSEDGYAWDMEELAQAIRSNGGVMRNPLSRQMFTPQDIRVIIGHRLGKGLAALQMEQSKLNQGVRSDTIDRLRILATVLSEDLSDDQVPSRTAVDEFLAYMATLPLSEQKTIDHLRVPAKDKHTGQSYDTTIGESIRDAQGNRVCFHKTGDFIDQAAQYLRKQK